MWEKTKTWYFLFLLFINITSETLVTDSFCGSAIMSSDSNRQNQLRLSQSDNLSSESFSEKKEETSSGSPEAKKFKFDGTYILKFPRCNSEVL